MSRTPPSRKARTAEPVADSERLTAALADWRETLMSVRKSLDDATAAVVLLRATLREMAPLWHSVSELDKSLTSVDWTEAIDEAAAEVEEPPAKLAKLEQRPRAVPEETQEPDPEHPRHGEAALQDDWPPEAAARPEAHTAAVPAETQAPEPEHPRRGEAALQADWPSEAAARPEVHTAAVPEETQEPEPSQPDREQPTAPSGAFTGRGRPLARPGAAPSDGGTHFSYSITVEEVGSRVRLVLLHQALGQVNGVRDLSLRSYTNGVAVVSVDSLIELQASAIEEAVAVGMGKPCRVVPGDGSSFLVRVGDSPASDGQQRQRGAA